MDIKGISRHALFLNGDQSVGHSICDLVGWPVDWSARGSRDQSVSRSGSQCVSSSVTKSLTQSFYADIMNGEPVKTFISAMGCQ